MRRLQLMKFRVFGLCDQIDEILSALKILEEISHNRQVQKQPLSKWLHELDK